MLCAPVKGVVFDGRAAAPTDAGIQSDVARWQVQCGVAAVGDAGRHDSSFQGVARSSDQKTTNCCMCKKRDGTCNRSSRESLSILEAANEHEKSEIVIGRRQEKARFCVGTDVSKTAECLSSSRLGVDVMVVMLQS